MSKDNAHYSYFYINAKPTWLMAKCNIYLRIVIFKKGKVNIRSLSFLKQHQCCTKIVLYKCKLFFSPEYLFLLYESKAQNMSCSLTIPHFLVHQVLLGKAQHSLIQSPWLSGQWQIYTSSMVYHMIPPLYSNLIILTIPIRAGNSIFLSNCTPKKSKNSSFHVIVSSSNYLWKTRNNPHAIQLKKGQDLIFSCD